MKNKATIFIAIVLLATGLYSCQKEEYVNPFETFVDIYFDAENTALRDNNGYFIAAKYNGQPIDWTVASKKMKILIGEGKFEFYDIRNGKTVAEKIIDVQPGDAETYMLFQPTIDAPVVFVDPGEQDAESPAPDGHIKLKLANYANDLIPFENLDIKVSINYFDADFNTVVAEVGTIRDVKNTVDVAAYQVLPDGLPNPLPEYGYSYVFDFVDGKTGEPLLNHGGTPYFNMAYSPEGFGPLPGKKVLTLYMVSNKVWGEAPPFIKKGDDFYEIATKVLFAD